MKTKIIIVNWLSSLAFLFTDNLVQGLIAFIWFAIASILVEKHKQKIIVEVNKFNKKIEKLIFK